MVVGVVAVLAFEDRRKSASDESNGFVGALNTNTFAAVDLIRAWDTLQTGEKDAGFDKIITLGRDLNAQATANADAWQRLQNTQLSAAIAERVEFIERVKEAADKGVTEQAMLADRRLTGEQQGIVLSYFGKDKKFDPDKIMADTVKAKVAADHQAELRDSIDKEILAKGTWQQLEQIGKRGWA